MQSTLRKETAVYAFLFKKKWWSIRIVLYSNKKEEETKQIFLFI